MMPEQNRRQKVFTRAALRLCGGDLCLSRRGLILNCDKTSNGLMVYSVSYFHLGCPGTLFEGLSPPNSPSRRDCTRDTSVSVPTDAVTKLMRPLFKHGYNVTSDRFLHLWILLYA